MPRFDGTGPQGLGPMTGRGLGPCRRGFGRGFYPQQVALTQTEEKKVLQAELKEIEAEKQEIEKRLKELK